jgi:cytochrome c oxidase subunit 4
MAHNNESMPHAHPTTQLYYSIFAALMVLLVVTVAAAYVDLGPVNFAVAAAIASTKAVLIILYFMHVRYSKPLTWIMAGASVAWLAILFGLTFSDYWTRESSPQLRSSDPPPQHEAHSAD